MTVHDWTRVLPGTFHHFHGSWITHIAEALNRSVLPADYYAMSEQHAGIYVPVVLTLETRRDLRVEPPQGAIALAEAPPDVSLHEYPNEATTYRILRRTLTIRHRSNRRIVAMIEIVSPGNKDSEQHLDEFVSKSVDALSNGIHLLVVDLHPPGRGDPQGIHGAIWELIGGTGFTLPPNKRLTLVSYMADRISQAFVEPTAVGQPLRDMPLFLTIGWYVHVPLQSTYTTAFEGLPTVVTDAVEGRTPSEWEQTTES
jgi:hypothetical protein